MNDESTVKIVAITSLAVVLVASVAGITIVAMTTDRSAVRATAFIFAGVVILALLGGLSWGLMRRRRHWRVHLDHLDEPTD